MTFINKFMPIEHQPEPTDEEDPREAEDRFPREETYDVASGTKPEEIARQMRNRIAYQNSIGGTPA